MSPNGITAILWDYDGTLVDTMQKNMAVTKIIIQEITGKDPLSFPALSSPENYAKAQLGVLNWREMYRREYQLKETQIDEAAILWPKYQIQDVTPCLPFAGIEKTLASLREFQQGIFSQNSSVIIRETLKQIGMSPFFKSVVGYEEVTFANQKPSPLGLFLSIEALTNNQPGTVFYIGDLETDILCAQNAKRHFQENGIDIDVISVAIHHQNGKLIENWQAKPDYHLTDITDLPDIIKQVEEN